MYAPTKDQLQAVVQRISERLAKLLTRQGLLTQDDDSSTLTLDALDDNALHHLQSHSVTYRVAVGPQQGKKVFTLQTIPAHGAELLAPQRWIQRCSPLSGNHKAPHRLGTAASSAACPFCPQGFPIRLFLHRKCKHQSHGLHVVEMKSSNP